MQFCPALAEHGIDVVVSPLLPDSYLHDLYTGKRRNIRTLLSRYRQRLNDIARGNSYDVVWLEKEAVPGLPGWLELLLWRKPVVLDVDDAWHLRYSKSSNLWFRALGKKLERLARSATSVVVANSAMHQWAEKAGAQSIHLVPTVVDVQRYPPTSLPGGPFTVGWIGTPSSRSYLDGIGAALRRVLSSEESRLLVVGLDHYSLPGVHVDTHPWSEEQEFSLLQQIHVGIMPLSGGPWEVAKSAYKAIQYMVVGRPVIASPVGSCLSVVREGITGFFATNQEDWVRTIDLLRADRALAAELGQAGRKRVEQNYSLQSQIPAVTSILKSAAGWK
jgi:glycosyltransferase involved in cell wall biosynthesis